MTATTDMFNQAVQLHRAARLSEAEALYRQILSQNPNHAEALHMLGVVAYQAGKNEAALALIDRAIALEPNRASSQGNRGLILASMARMEEAITAYQRALSLEPGNAVWSSNLGIAFRRTGRKSDGIAWLRRALAIQPNNTDAMEHLADALTEDGRAEEAIALAGRAVALQPNRAETRNNYGVSLNAAGRKDEAIVEFRAAIALRPEFPEALVNLAAIMIERGKLHEAEDLQRRGLAARPNFAELYNNLGTTLFRLARPEEAEEAYLRALALRPDLPMARMNLGISMLARGEFRRGWAEYEWRFQCRAKDLALPARPILNPPWDGSDPGGKRILIQSEQGIGDTLQFIRYAPLLARRGAKVIAGVMPLLARIVRSVQEIERVVTELPPDSEFDIHCTMMSLPGKFDTTLETIPHEIPYLAAAESDVAQWKSRVAVAGDRLRVGLVWAGKPENAEDHARSIKLAAFAPLAAVPGVWFCSLQKGAAAKQAASPPQGMELTDWTEELSDFADTAALIANLDLVVTVDTAVAHLAGAMGKPVWTLIQLGPDWRWMLKREDTPWYPTMRLFRQTVLENWNEPIAKIAAELLLVKSRRSADNSAKLT